MSTDSPRPTTADQSPADAPKPRGIDLSLTKIVGGALAAMTAAALGSTLSVAGTVIGAAVASVVAAVAGALYTASIQRTHDRVRTVFTGRVGGAELPTTVEVVEVAETPSAQTTDAAPGWVLPDPAAPASAERGPRRRVEWKGVLLGALAAFVLAAGCLTLFEVVSGHALSGGKGTTISQVGGGDRQPTKPTVHPTATPTPIASTEPSATPSSSATTAPEPSSQPTPSATASSSPTASDAPTATPSGSDSATPGTNASAPGAAEGQASGPTTP